MLRKIVRKMSNMIQDEYYKSRKLKQYATVMQMLLSFLSQLSEDELVPRSLFCLCLDLKDCWQGMREMLRKFLEEEWCGDESRNEIYLVLRVCRWGRARAERCLQSLNL